MDIGAKGSPSRPGQAEATELNPRVDIVLPHKSQKHTPAKDQLSSPESGLGYGVESQHAYDSDFDLKPV